ncbi:hypothetical protein CLG96_01160 [Sphingomonas oleivorans]|uniref:Uncharacterized protein n=1 Tax=Sphingomonas oleivorans TaxID=1735121 RepID=A0A2T5G0W4_9SPHN|nr:hypothetical protein [Sphingomonas oleivorans]PTQ12787.1 hypothetical protein CLG96_01160 [Sphingomonas oleivorans]
MKNLFAFAGLALVMAAPAAAESGAFSRDGYDFTYDMTTRDDVTLINGRNETTGQRFSLRVHGNRVSGLVGGQRVSFSRAVVGDAQYAAR